MSFPLHTAWIAGATGLVGRALLGQLLDTQPHEALALHALQRRIPADWPSHPRLQTHAVDFGAAELDCSALPAPQTVFICLGTTIRQAGSQAAFRAVDLEAVLKVARAARAAGAGRCAVVSALGADARSRVFYNRVKGEMEQALAALDFERLVIARPSLLLGERSALGQPLRPGEIWGERIARALGPLIPARWRPIAADHVARALRLAPAQPGPAVQLLESDALQRLGQAQPRRGA